MDRRVVDSFIEFYINDQPLSSLLDSNYNGQDHSVLKNNVGVLGSFQNVPLEIIKVKQLLGQKISDADFAELSERLSKVVDECSIEDMMDNVRDELANPQILIYCCAACGDYLCGGVTVEVGIGDENVTWTFNEGNQKAVFVFDKYSYYDTLKSYLSKINASLFRGRV